MKKRINIKYLFIAILLLCIAIPAIILGVLRQNWLYYIIGCAVGLINHYLLVIQYDNTLGKNKTALEKELFRPKRSVALWYLLRCVIFLVVFVVLIYFSDIKSDKNNIWSCIIALCGFIVVKVIFIAYMLSIKKEGDQ